MKAGLPCLVHDPPQTPNLLHASCSTPGAVHATCMPAIFNTTSMQVPDMPQLRAGQPALLLHGQATVSATRIGSAVQYTPAVLVRAAIARALAAAAWHSLLGLSHCSNTPAHQCADSLSSRWQLSRRHLLPHKPLVAAKRHSVSGSRSCCRRYLTLHATPFGTMSTSP